MHYLIRSFFTVSLASTYFVASILMAEPLFDYNSFNPSAMQPTLGQLNQPISPSDFKSKVRSLGEKNRNELSQQVKQELRQQKPSTVTATPPASTGTTTTPTATTGTGALPPPPEAQLPPKAAEAPVSPTFSTSAPGASPPPPPTNFGTQAPASQGQVYTGFGTGTGTGSSPSSTPAPPPTPGGWNIKY